MLSFYILSSSLKKGVPHITLMTIAQEQRVPYLRYNGGIPEESQRQISTIVM